MEKFARKLPLISTIIIFIIYIIFTTLFIILFDRNDDSMVEYLFGQIFLQTYLLLFAVLVLSKNEANRRFLKYFFDSVSLICFFIFAFLFIGAILSFELFSFLFVLFNISLFFAVVGLVSITDKDKNCIKIARAFLIIGTIALIGKAAFISIFTYNSFKSYQGLVISLEGLLVYVAFLLFYASCVFLLFHQTNKLKIYEKTLYYKLDEVFNNNLTSTNLNEEQNV